MLIFLSKRRHFLLGLEDARNYFSKKLIKKNVSFLFDFHQNVVRFGEGRKIVPFGVTIVEGIPSILTMTICMLNYYYTCYVCSSRESRTVVDRGFLYI